MRLLIVLAYGALMGATYANVEASQYGLAAVTALACLFLAAIIASGEA